MPRRASPLLAGLSLALLALGTPALHAAEPAAAELGLPFFDAFDPRDYRGHMQVWGAVEDAAGITYFGNYDGVVTYDGARWDRIDVPGGTFVRALVVDDRDVLWIGGVNQVGYAAADATGRRTFVSLRDRVPEAARNFSELWRVVLTPRGPVFQSNSWVLRWDGRAFAAVALPPGSGWQMIATGETIWLTHGQHGWFNLQDDGTALTLVRRETPAVFQGSTLGFAVPGHAPGEHIVGTLRLGLFRWDGKDFTPYVTEADEILKQNRAYRGARLADGRLVIAMRQGGAILLDPQGRLLARLDDAAGIPGEGMLAVMAARNDTVWICLQRGMIRIDVRPWLTWFGPQRGAPRSVMHAPVRFQGRLYLTSDYGLYHLASAKAGAPARLEAVPEFGDFLEGLRPAGDDTLIGFGEGLFAWPGPGRPRVPLPGDARAVFEFLPAATQPGRWFALQDGGLHTYRREGDRWIYEGQLATLGHVRSLAEQPDGTWWMGTPSDGVLRVKFPAASATGPGEPVFQRFTAGQGLPAGHGWARVTLQDGRPLLRCEQGFFRLDAAGRTFEPTTEFGEQFADGRMTTRTMSEARDGVWIVARPAGEAELISTVELGLHGAKGWQPVHVPQLARLDDVYGLEEDEEQDLLWIAGHGGLVRIDLARWRAEPAPPPPGLRLRTADNAGRLLPLAGGWELPYARRALSLRFAAPALTGDRAALYESTLLGGGEPLVVTDATPARDFSALASGDYRLRLRARRGDGVWSAPVELAFTIRPPWWRSGWAWAAYALAGGALVAAYIRGRTRALRRRAVELETVIAARTEDLRRSNAELARLNQLELDEKIAAKLAEEKARLELLRYQLNPHFLLNAFTTLRGLVFKQPEQAGHMVARLAEFCRLALTRTDETGGTVADEVTLIETYLATEKTRWRDNLTCRVESDPAVAGVRLPPFLLQPLVENAVKYGGRTSPDHLEIRVHIAGDGATGLRIEVANTGEWVEPTSPHRENSTGLGLENLRQRLRRYYPEAHSLDTQSAGGWVRIVLHLRQPARDPFAATHAAH